MPPKLNQQERREAREERKEAKHKERGTNEREQRREAKHSEHHEKREGKQKAQERSEKPNIKNGLTKQGTIRALELLANPQIVAHVAAHPDQYHEIHTLLDQITRLWSQQQTSELPTHPELRLSNGITVETRLELAEWMVELPSYNEVFTRENQVREAYQDIIPVIDQIIAEQPSRIDQFPEQSLRDFQKDNRLYHIPRMFTISESTKIKTGVSQRAKALQLFLEDFYANQLQCRAVKENVIPKAIFQQILDRNAEENVGKYSNRIVGRWNFWYGPDILRGSDGEFYVCEDNIGYVGGLGDLICARESLLRGFPEFAPHIGGVDPSLFYDQLARYYRSLVKPGEIVVLLHYPRDMTADNEERRVLSIFRKRGIKSVVLPVGKHKKWKSIAELSVTSSGVIFTKHNPRKGGPPVKKNVGLVIVDAEPFDIDPRNFFVRRKAMLDEAASWAEALEEKIQKLSQANKPQKLAKIQRTYNELQALRLADPGRTSNQALAKYLRHHRKDEFKDLLKQGVRGLYQAYFSGKVQLVNGPGTDFLGDKLICMFTSNLIRLYLNEEPIIKEIPTMSFADKAGNLDKSLMNSVFSDPLSQQHMVIKRVDGRGGSAVWVGPKIPVSEFQATRALISAEPGAFIVQKYLNLSEVDGNLVDIRNLANVGAKEIIVSDTLWGRGISLEGNGKVNISDQGFEFAICTAKH